ncbi:MAG: flagellar basal body-associated FliL family protein [Rhodospirillales bacterium]|nr:flagellar basal body-associated FliL family protein [Rhodospirillales bacterium]MCB9995510.1 flagellar basal body-associated FliL family protein [Rhodospirillales bacterium]
MRLIVLALLAIVIFAGGGAGAYFYFKQPAEASIGDTDDHKAAKEAKHEKGDGHGGGGHEFVELDPLILPIVDSNGVSQIVSLVVVIEVDGGKNREKVQKLQPRLKDAYIQELYGVLNRHAALKGGVIQVGMIKAKLAEISDRVMGDDVVEDVLLQVVQQRPI